MENPPRVAFYTLGCKLNFSETSTIARSFRESGYLRVDFEDSPDVFVINTCSVTENADKKCRALVKKAKKISPDSFVAVIGCFAQLKPQEIHDMEGVNLVLGANEKFNLPQYIKAGRKNHEKEMHACEIQTVESFVPSWSSGDRTRSFFKVQDGCDYSCSFCTIPLARGKSRSNTIAETLSEARKLIAETGAKEIVLTGVNTGDFGRKNGESFYQLIQQLDNLEADVRFRISSIEPNLLTDEIIGFVAQAKKFVPHFHIPLQSGSNHILSAMRRRYKRELYADRISLIKNTMPDCCVGVDVIVGFPGETDAHFMETFDFLKELPVSYLHVFTYSERPNTHAINLEGAVPNSEREKRSKMLHILSEKKKRAFYDGQTGRKWPILWESEQNDSYMFGFTPNYVKTKKPWNPESVNTISEIVLDKIDSDGIMIASVSELIPIEKTENLI